MLFIFGRKRQRARERQVDNGKFKKKSRAKNYIRN